MALHTEQFAMSKFASRQDRDDAMLAEIERLTAEVAGLATILDTLRTDRYGQKYMAVESRSGSMVHVDAAIDAALAARKGEA